METDRPERVDTGVGRLILKAVAVLLIGSGAGFAYNAFSDAGIPLRTSDAIPLSGRIEWNLHVEGMRVTLDEAKRAFDRKDAVFIDTRSPDAYAAGHIPGALSIPVLSFELRIRHVLGDLPKDTWIIAYCGGRSCRNSFFFVRLMIEDLGYTRTQAFYEGWNAWFWANYPITKGDAP